MKKLIRKISEIFKLKSNICEAHGNLIDEDFKFRRVTKSSTSTYNENDIPQVIRDRMYRVVYDLHLRNPFAKRILEITRDFAIGDGIQYECDDEEVKKVIKKFWNDTANNLDIEIPRMAYDLGLWGELVLRANVNPINGFVTFSYLNPSDIKEVIVDQENNKLVSSIIFYSEDKFKDKEYKIIKEDERGLLEGEIFYYRVNNLTNQIRGLSDLLPLIDWLDALDQFLFNSLERTALLNSFIYHIQWDGLSKEEVYEQIKTFGKVKPGSIYHTNEKVKISAITPNIKANDISELARVIKNFILGGAGFPEHWFSEGGYTSRATAKEMGYPTFQKLKERQTLILKIIRDMIIFQVDQAYKSGRLTFDLNNRPDIRIRCIDVKESNIEEWSSSLLNLANFIIRSVDSGLIDKEFGKNILQSTLELNGFRKI